MYTNNNPISYPSSSLISIGGLGRLAVEEDDGFRELLLELRLPMINVFLVVTSITETSVQPSLDKREIWLIICNLHHRQLFSILDHF